MVAWLKKSGFGDNTHFLEWIEREEIGGTALTLLTEQLIRKAPGLKTTLGFRLKLIKVFDHCFLQTRIVPCICLIINSPSRRQSSR